MIALTWADLGQTNRPGEYTFRNGQIRLRRRHIQAWKADPDGVWMLSSYVAAGGRTRFGTTGFAHSEAFKRRAEDRLGSDPFQEAIWR